MTQERLHELLKQMASNFALRGNLVSFELNGTPLVAISDPEHDRMRLLSPIVELAQLDASLLRAALEANFYTTLDARYAAGDGVLYAAFMHPLSSLTSAQLTDAVAQVANARNSFGTSFSAGSLQYGR